MIVTVILSILFFTIAFYPVKGNKLEKSLKTFIQWFALIPAIGVWVIYFVWRLL